VVDEARRIAGGARVDGDAGVDGEVVEVLRLAGVADAGAHALDALALGDDLAGVLDDKVAALERHGGGEPDALVGRAHRFDARVLAPAEDVVAAERAARTRARIALVQHGAIHAVIAAVGRVRRRHFARHNAPRQKAHRVGVRRRRLGLGGPGKRRTRHTRASRLGGVALGAAVLDAVIHTHVAIGFSRFQATLAAFVGKVV
jgi:hypothetical protein